MPNFSDIVDAYRKLPTSLFVAITFLLAMILFSPHSWTEKLNLSEFRANYGAWLGPAFLLVTAILVSRLFTFFSERIIGFQKNRERLEKLKTLTSDEKGYLKIFLENDTSTISREISDGVICSLESKRIVYRSSNLSSHWKTFPYSLYPWARKALKKQPELLN
ncbi:superinfection exclusion B family protein [Winslowiella iniecta]|uniref:superinfection exclusion B family protein n=1 Tax=Winslowiella iniecta TaxID=1560201 RepID=UPI00092D593F|nr:superinfection exclusion B family protein [Winslowiella iniecta]